MRSCFWVSFVVKMEKSPFCRTIFLKMSFVWEKLLFFWCQSEVLGGKWLCRIVVVSITIGNLIIDTFLSAYSMWICGFVAVRCPLLCILSMYSQIDLGRLSILGSI